MFGFPVILVMAVAVQLFALRFHASRLDRPMQVSSDGLLMVLGAVLRVLAEPMAVDAGARPTLLAISGGHPTRRAEPCSADFEILSAE